MKNSRFHFPIITKVLLFIAFFPNWALAYNIATHFEISNQSITIIRSSLNNYLKSNLGLSLTSSFVEANTGQRKSAQDWISIGSKFEDGESLLEIIRTRQHFHNPISNSGLSDTFSGVSTVNWAISNSGNDLFYY